MTALGPWLETGDTGLETGDTGLGGAAQSFLPPSSITDTFPPCCSKQRDELLLQTDTPSCPFQPKRAQLKPLSRPGIKSTGTNLQLRLPSMATAVQGLCEQTHPRLQAGVCSAHPLSSCIHSIPPPAAGSRQCPARAWHPGALKPGLNWLLNRTLLYN